MPSNPLKPCRYPGCPSLTQGGYCAAHAGKAQRHRDKARGTATQRGYGYQWSKIRAQILCTEPNCRGCGRPATTVDHIVPISRGGTNDVSNLQPLCHQCHNYKTAQQRKQAGAGQKSTQRPSKEPHRQPLFCVREMNEAGRNG